MPAFLKSLHASHAMRCIAGLPGSRADLDTSRLAIAYYTLSALDVLGILDEKDRMKDADREEWRDWIWKLTICGDYGFGFRPGSSMESVNDGTSSIRYDLPHLIMTYTALLSLSILRDDFSRLDRNGLVKFLASVQHEDGSFSPLPIDFASSETDMRLTFCAFAICSMLDDWSGINIQKAVQFIKRCRTYEGGFGEAPGCEAQGGPTYCATAALRLLFNRPDCPPEFSSPACFPDPFFTSSETTQTVRWLVQRQNNGFQGRTEKTPDACYSFWCGAALKILDSEVYVDSDAATTYLSACQFKYGGIANAPGENPDPYHTYLSLASLSLYPPTAQWLNKNAVDKSTWRLHHLDPLLNLRLESATWARQHIPQDKSDAG